MAKTQDEQFAANEAAKKYIESKTTGFIGNSGSSTAPVRLISRGEGGDQIDLELSSKSDGSTALRKVSSCTLAHAVSIRGTETRTVSAIKLDFKACGLVIIESERGLEISYNGTDTTRYTFITPWANVVQFSYEK